MKLWVLEPRENLPAGRDPWFRAWESARSYVVRAESEDAARSLVSKNANGDECKILVINGAETRIIPWADPELTSCTEIAQDGEEEIIAIG